MAKVEMMFTLWRAYGSDERKKMGQIKFLYNFERLAIQMYDALDQQGVMFFWLYSGVKYDFRRVVVICSFGLVCVRLRRLSGNE